ncbi:MAG TPA: histidinol-phosphate transaminase, partial [Verrucomicrobiae bacterium]|nr:histidinol-phosphate transaminase [Verrucomicrobiae bacterium]
MNNPERSFTQTALRAAFEPSKLRLALADDAGREQIYRLRHEIYARELGQYSENESGRLTDSLDSFNDYIVASTGKTVLGFISVTPPGRNYSIDKYVQRDRLHFALDESVFEVRLLTVIKSHRRRELALLLMYAAARWVAAQGGRRIVAIGRDEVMSIYLRAGLKPLGMGVQSGKVKYHLMYCDISELPATVKTLRPALERARARVDWELRIPFSQPAQCFHGGAFFEAIGERFDSLEKAKEVINADVLDAWFPPSPKVLAALRENLDWILRTSPPTSANGLIETIAAARGVTRRQILTGAGSSSLIFLAFPQWLNAASRVLILDPTYGEYAHVLEKVLHCEVDRFALRREEEFTIALPQLIERCQDGFDMVALVNPNSPTGTFQRREEMFKLVRQIPERTLVWIDETYIDYVGRDQSFEPLVHRFRNVVVCKSMSKTYALSGARTAYLCAAPHLLEGLRALTPPWAVSLPAQISAVKALEDTAYYEERYLETAAFRDEFVRQLRGKGFVVTSSPANFLLVHLDPNGPPAADVVQRCRKENVHLRDAALMGQEMGRHT